jgi:phosphoenolpyruvate carboxykinase (GTP)
MLPFTGYNMADYWQHWLDFGSRKDLHLPQIFRVNWFLKNEEGQFIWPGFGENARVLRWIAQRLEGKAQAVQTPIGNLPVLEDLGVAELDLPAGAEEQLLGWGVDDVEADLRSIQDFLSGFGERTPEALIEEANLRLAELQR